MVYWKSEHFWLGKLVDHPEIMAQGTTIEELESNLKEAYVSLVLENVPDHYQVKVLTLTQADIAKQQREYPLRSTPVSYGDPTEPVAQDDWEALR